MIKLEISTKYRVFIISIFFVLLVLGVYLGFKFSSNQEAKRNNESEQVVNNNDNKEDEDVEIYEEVSTKKYDILVKYEDYYSLCDHTIKKEETIHDTTVDKLKSEILLKNENKGYEVVEETNETLTLKRTLNENCPNHFEVKYENGSIIIDTIVDKTIKTRYKTIDIPQEHIRPEMLEELINGITVDSREELNLLIEDLES